MCVPSALPVNVSPGMVDVAFVGTPTGQDIVGCVNDPAAMVGTPAGHEIAGVDAAIVPIACEWADPAPLVTELPVNVSAGIVLVAFVGTPAGHDIVCVCVPSAEPVNVGVCAMAFATPPVVLESAPVVSALIVPAGVPADTAAVVGTPAGHDMTCAGPVTVPFVPAAVTLCV